MLVLAQPLERTGVFLPLLPVLGFWLASSEVDFSLLLFVIGGLYGLMAVLRRSFVFGVMAAVAGNAGLWYILHRTEDYQFLQHPQLWLIPVALSVLLAAYLNEDNLSEDQMTGVRYLSLVTIVVDRGHIHQRRRELALASADTRIVFVGGRIRGNHVSHQGNAAARLGISVVIDYHHDLVRLRKLRLDLALVRGRHRYGRHDHLHVRRLREETARSHAHGRGTQGMGAVDGGLTALLSVFPLAGGQ
jgi:hypothetical protein